MPKLKGKLKASSKTHILEKFLQTYEKHCTSSQSCISITIKQGLKKCIENEIFITKVTSDYKKSTILLEMVRYTLIF